MAGRCRVWARTRWVGGDRGRGVAWKDPLGPPHGRAAVRLSAWPVQRRRAPRLWEITRYRHRCNSQAGALFVMQDTGWDHALKVTAEGEGLVGHAGAVLLRKLAD